MLNLNFLSCHVQNQPELTYTQVLEKEGRFFRLEGFQGVQAVLAASCLLEPEVGDLVLVSGDLSRGHAFLLSVLVKSNPQKDMVVLPSGARMVGTDGDLEIKGDALNFSAKKTLSLSSIHTEINSVSATMRGRVFEAWFDSIETNAVKAVFKAKSLIGNLGRSVVHALESLRWIDGLDEIRAGRSQSRISGDYDVQSKHATIRAEGFVRIDGQKIDLG